MAAGKLSGALRNKTLYNFIFPLSTVGWSGSGMGVGRGRPKLLRWGEGGRCAIKLCTILFFRARRHDKAGGVLRRSPLKGRGARCPERRVAPFWVTSSVSVIITGAITASNGRYTNPTGTRQTDETARQTEPSL